ncbi:MAG: L-lysine 6-transaminase [bacterium]
MAAITPDKVHEILGRHMLADGFDMVLDLERSTPFRIVDSREDRAFLDFFTFFASSPLGVNHPKLDTPEFRERLGRVAVNKPSNSDLYTLEMAELVETMDRVAIPDHLPHLFFVSGGALAVENALKVAFDWKVRKNMAEGRGEKGSKVLHFRWAFHGRSGYTMSLTNTADPRKYMYFPRFDWPRIDPPELTFPVDPERARIRDDAALKAVAEAFAADRDDIAAVIVEPIMAEGGDKHLSSYFLQGLGRLCDENDAMFILDEVQTGVGLTGTFWAHQGLEVTPDIIAFGKKTQVCGILAGPKVDRVEKHCFEESSRINSTWGGNLVDMVRFTRILEIIEEDGLVDNAREVGGYLLEGLSGLQEEFSMVTNVRGRGLLCAFDLPDGGMRDEFLNRAYSEGILILGCGTRSIRFRPPLQTTREHVDDGLEAVRSILGQLASEGSTAAAAQADLPSE